MFRGNLTYEFTLQERQLLFHALSRFVDQVPEVYAEVDPDVQAWAKAKTVELRNKFDGN